MASVNRKPRTDRPDSPGPSRRGGDLVGLGLLTLGALLLAGLHTADAGPLLAGTVELLRLILGRLTNAVPFLLFFAGTLWLFRGGAPPAPVSGVGLALAALALAGLWHNRVPLHEELTMAENGQALLWPVQEHGGWVGLLLVLVCRRLMGPVGCDIVLGMMLLAGLVLSSERPIRDLWYAMGEWLRQAALRRAETARAAAPPAARAPRRTRATIADAPPAELPPPPPDLPIPLYLRDDPAEPIDYDDSDTRPLTVAPEPEPTAPAMAATAAPELPAATEPEPLLNPAPPPVGEPVETAAETPSGWHPTERIVRPPVPLDPEGHPRQLTLPGMPEPPERSEVEAAWYTDGEPTTYKLPPLQLVEPPRAAPPPDRTGEILANSQRLEATLDSFRIQAKVVNTEVGPTVTRYEMELAPGIRVSKVAVLADDIAMALASTGIRIEAPVPGKGVIGIEVPNQNRETVHLHPLLLSKEFRNAPGPLPFVLGKDIAGGIRIAELTRMPHVLVAGTTNSGKSVCLNCLIISLIYRLSPRDLRFLMIDPKRVELTLYDGIPHLDRPVVTDPEDAADLLRGAVHEMMARYDRMHDLGVRNVASYNQQVDEEERMPYLVIIIDELAELMMLARAAVEASICRLAQLARATGIHLVVATQRPAVNVVTGQIKANIGTRVAFSVAQQVDSRVILDQVGAERLIGRGDMLYNPIDGSKPERMQGAFVDEHQVHRLVEYLQAMPSTLRVKYAESIIQPIAADDEGPEDDRVEDMDLDERFWECVDFVRREGIASTSRLQRTHGIGFNRAGRIMDQMHQLGIVGPGRGSKPREVLPGGPMGPGDLKRREQGLFDLEAR